jgi:hypothetical protein
MHIETFEISERFCGPPRSGNGGYVCGRIAKHVPGINAVRLRIPPPLKMQLRLESTDEGAQLFHEENLVGEAKPSTLDMVVPTCPSFEQAVESAKHYLGFKNHAFPSCFVCGPNRKTNDGLRIFPGPLEKGLAVAAPWLPESSLADEFGNVKSEFLWSALDCTGAFAAPPVPEGLTIVLGELRVSIEADLDCTERCIAVGWSLGSEGRKLFVGSAIYAESGRLIAKARAIWLTVPANSWS